MPHNSNKNIPSFKFSNNYYDEDESFSDDDFNFSDDEQQFLPKVKALLAQPKKLKKKVNKPQTSNNNNTICQSTEVSNTLTSSSSSCSTPEDNDEEQEQKADNDNLIVEKCTSEGTITNKEKLTPADKIYNRIHWDAAFSPFDFTIGYVDRFRGIQEMRFIDFVSLKAESEGKRIAAIPIPFHRIRYFKYHDMIVWDKVHRINILNSVANIDSDADAEMD